MALTDYTYIVTLGQACTVNFQLARAAGMQKIPPATCMGPFDWLFLDMAKVLACIEGDFARYFQYATTYPAKVQDPNDCWRMTDAHGITTAHQMLRDGSEPEPLPEAWFEFGKWIGRRLESWETRTRDERGKVLFLRLEATWQRDDVSQISRLIELLRSKVAGAMSVAWIRYESAQPSPALEHPALSTHYVRKTWPAHLSEHQIHWMRDYGSGLAWRGHDGDWDRVFASL
jgi:hypothetical protein